MPTALLRAQIEKEHPSAFVVYRRPARETIRTGIAQIDQAIGGVPLHSLTEICGSSLASSGKTSVMTSLLAQASQNHSCALVDASDSFDLLTGHAAGINFSSMLWVRCGINKMKFNRLEQAFKVADLLLQSGGFQLIVVDLSGLGEQFVRRVPLSSWFRFSRAVEKQPTALVFVTREPHATSCAGVVLRLRAGVAAFSGGLLPSIPLHAEVLRVVDKRHSHSVTSEFSMKAQWA